MAATAQDSPRGLPSAARWLVGAAAFVVVMAGMRQAQTILAPVLLAAFLTIIAAVPLAWLARKGLPKCLALLLVLGAAVVVVATVVSLVGVSVDRCSSKLPEHQHRLEARTQEGVAWLAKRGINISATVKQGGLNLERLLSLAGSAVSVIGSLSGNLALDLLIFIFMVVETAGMRSKLSAIWGNESDRLARVDHILANVRHYVALKTWMSFLIGALAALWLVVLGVDYPLLWGLQAFGLYYVPNIGSMIAAVPPVCLALVQIGVPTAVYTAVGYVVITNVVGNVIEPRIMGRGLGLSALVVFLSLLFWGWVLGPVGMVLSVPLTMIAKIVLEGSSDTAWIGVLLGTGAPVRRLADDGLRQEERAQP